MAEFAVAIDPVPTNVVYVGAEADSPDPGRAPEEHRRRLDVDDRSPESKRQQRPRRPNRFQRGLRRHGERQDVRETDGGTT